MFNLEGEGQFQANFDLYCCWNPPIPNYTSSKQLCLLLFNQTLGCKV